MEISDADSVMLREALARDEVSLLRTLGEMNYLGATPAPPEILIKRGRDWLENRLASLRTAVCVNKGVRSAAEGDLFALAQALWVAIAVYFGKSETVAIVAALLVKQGIQGFCAETWKVAHATDQ